MIRFVAHHEIDKEKWDHCIRESFNGNIYAWSWYLDIVHQNWNALVEDDYIRVFPLTGNVRFGIHYLFQPFFTQQLGIFSPQPLPQEVIHQFIHAIPKQYRLVEIRLNIHNTLNLPPSVVNWHTNYELDLIKDYEYHARAYNSNTKRNLKKALESQLYIVDNVSPVAIIDLFKNNRGRTISHWNDREYWRLKRLINAVIFHGQATTYGVYTKENELCAGAIFVKSHQRITFLFSGMSAFGKEKNALTLILDHAIRQYAGSYMIFDFEGSDNPNLARFYKGFGSQPVSYPGITLNRLPWPFNFIFKLIRLRRKI
ncbi:MAG: hypothetical protein H3C41_06360 [Bacteroidales bacterium]|nr:hypothetical protein [Bacteroidales bacterium]